MSEKKIGTKLLPLVQLIPAAVVGAAIVVTLPHTVPVLQAIPQRLTAPAASSEAVEPEPEEPALPTLPYEDGVYTGSSRGYGGKVKVQVTMEDGYITDLQIVDASHETAAFLKRAKRLLNTVMENQTWEVDAVSEATYTSRGILGAIKNALTGEVVNNPAPPQQTKPKPAVVEEFTAPSAYRDGVYTASAEGFGGQITMQVTIADGAIADIAVVSAEGETPSYMSRARSVISAVLTAGSPDVDSVSGATYSSTGILNAVKRALAKAADSEVEQELAEAAEPTAAQQYIDGVYTGTAIGYGGDITVAVTVADGRITGIDVLSADGEDESFFARGKTILTHILESQQTDVDAISGATYSSAGLRDAVRNALGQAAAAQPAPETGETEAELAGETVGEAEGEAASGETEAASGEAVPEQAAASESTEQPAESETASGETLPEQTAASESTAAEAAESTAAAQPQYVDGTYSAVAVCSDGEEFTYDVRVTVTIQNGTLIDVQVERENDTSYEPEANRRYLDRAKNGRTLQNVRYPGVAEQAMSRQSADAIDAVSGATYSSRAIQTALAQALAQAKRPEANAK